MSGEIRLALFVSTSKLITTFLKFASVCDIYLHTEVDVGIGFDTVRDCFMLQDYYKQTEELIDIS